MQTNIIKAEYVSKLGLWVSKTNTTVYLAETDGTALGYSTGGSGTPSIATDADNPPTTTRMSGVNNADGQTISKVKKGHYWKADGCLTALWWIPDIISVK